MNTKVALILAAMDDFHRLFYEIPTFSGPSLHFHKKSLTSADSGEFDDFVEDSYAMLASWGMHRMGTGGPKMQEFQLFRDSIEVVWESALLLRNREPSALSVDDWAVLRGIFIKLEVMSSRSALVANSKIMAHLLPNLIAPVDREYTLSFLFENRSLPNDADRNQRKQQEWEKLRLIHTDFFHPLIGSPEFVAQFARWQATPDNFLWDTSPLKTADNLVIGAQRVRRQEEAN